MKKLLMCAIVMLFVLLSACTQHTQDKPQNEQKTESTAEYDDISNTNEISEILENRQIIKVDANYFEITDEVDLTWLSNQLVISESASIPNEVMALELDVILYFDDETIAEIRYLSDREDILSFRYDEVSYTVKNTEIARWLDTLE